MNFFSKIDGEVMSGRDLSSNNFIKSFERLDIETTNILLNRLGSNIEIKEFVDKNLFKGSQEYCGNLGLSSDNKFINIIYVLNEPSLEELKSFIDLQVIISNSLKRDKLDTGEDVDEFETLIVALEHVGESVRKVKLYGRDFLLKQYSVIDEIDQETFDLIFERLQEISNSLSKEERAKLFFKAMIGDGEVADEFIDYIKSNPIEKSDGSDFERTIEFEPKKGGRLKFSIRKATEEDLKRHNIDPNDIEKYMND